MKRFFGVAIRYVVIVAIATLLFFAYSSSPTFATSGNTSPVSVNAEVAAYVDGEEIRVDFDPMSRRAFDDIFGKDPQEFSYEDYLRTTRISNIVTAIENHVIKNELHVRGIAVSDDEVISFTQDWNTRFKGCGVDTSVYVKDMTIEIDALKAHLNGSPDAESIYNTRSSKQSSWIWLTSMCGTPEEIADMESYIPGRPVTAKVLKEERFLLARIKLKSALFGQPLSETDAPPAKVIEDHHQRTFRLGEWLKERMTHMDIRVANDENKQALDILMASWPHLKKTESE